MEGREGEEARKEREGKDKRGGEERRGCLNSGHLFLLKVVPRKVLLSSLTVSSP